MNIKLCLRDGDFLSVWVNKKFHFLCWSVYLNIKNLCPSQIIETNIICLDKFIVFPFSIWLFSNGLSTHNLCSESSFVTEQGSHQKWKLRPLPNPGLEPSGEASPWIIIHFEDIQDHGKVNISMTWRNHKRR